MEVLYSCGRVAFAIITISCWIFCFTSSPAIACPFPERNLLVDFEVAVVDEYNTLSSWHGFNCCTWRGVSCNIRTGHVSRLDLSGFNLEGNISSSLFQLAQLEHLDLSDNLFQGNFSPPYNRKLKTLTFLDLSFAGYVSEFYVSLESLSNLVSLEYLSLAAVNISASKEWGEAVGSLPNLQKLSMSDCGLGGPIPNPLLNLTSLLHLDLSYNYLSAQVPSWFENLTAHLLSLDLSLNENLGGDLSFIEQRKSSSSLTSIELSETDMKGRIPSGIWNISCLKHLVLSRTGIEGETPAAIGNLISLQSLDLSATRIEGAIPAAIGNLISLQSLDLLATRIEGEIPSAIWNMPSLKDLLLSATRIEGEIPSAIGNALSLESLSLFDTRIEGKIPSAIGNVSSLKSLNLYNTSIEGEIPLSIVNLSKLVSLELVLQQVNWGNPTFIGLTFFPC
ncbi:hypothetical protein SUGI_0870660 [Cryptomeria japonica]|uniref:leucine-rich repeat receptor-like protein kinase PXC2 n=1 Tax=Cryptomeria japonica TaxID=3369 RepID=UPI0024147602|nr:leucine-rich repeat receptor-like protein kinase PXC2 [Cryptomeria japonica]GLJ42047.1 hypothetical protein SUGI_0870660 [Cryptomeria japonica]